MAEKLERERLAEKEAADIYEAQAKLQEE